MAAKPAKACTSPGCRGLVRDDVCNTCGPRSTTGWSKHRGTRQERGYDEAWLRLRQNVIDAALREAAENGYPWATCGICGQPIDRPDDKQDGLDVDHIKEFSGIDDPLRLNTINLRCVHRRCHMSKTAGRSKRT